MIRLYTRRKALLTGGATLAGLGATAVLPFRARAAGHMDGSDTFETDTGQIVVHPISHASLVLEVPGMVIHVDPVGDAALYAGLPAADLILITHEHGDHYNAETLAALVGENTTLITNPAVFAMLSDEMKAKATALANGDSTTVGNVAIDAIPAYNITEDRLQYHPQGRDNGYVLSVDGRRVYVAGDTEGTPEMRALADIDVAFVPMNLPYTMDEAQAASAVAEFAPAFVYPYHYRGTDTERFAALVAEAGAPTEVLLKDWYAGSA